MWHFSKSNLLWVLPLLGITVWLYAYTHVNSKTDKRLLEKHDIPYVENMEEYKDNFVYCFGSRDKMDYGSFVDLNRTSDLLPIPVIVITYQRSGSSFVGNILRLNDDAFYFFEPLHFLKSGYKNLHYLDLKNRSFSTFLTAADFVIRKVITCKFQHLPLEFWKVSFYADSIQGYQLRSFYQKFKSEFNRRYSDPSMFKKVLVDLENTCKSSKAVIIKTIRTPLFLLRDFLSSFPNLKIIHLIRDPRPTISSQKIYGSSVLKSTADRAYNLCARVYNDVITFDILSFYHPNNLIRLMYESLTMNPLKITKDLYAFINITFSNTVANSLHLMTSSNISHQKLMFPEKAANSTQLQFRWRLKETFKFVMDVDSQCYALYRKLGYKPVSSENMLRNLSIPLFVQNTSVLAVKLL